MAQTVVQAFPDGMVAPQDWLDLILPKFPGGVPDMIKHEVLTIVRDLCRVGSVWCEWVPPITVDGSRVEYPVVTGYANVEAVTVLAARREMSPGTTVDLLPVGEQEGGPGVLVPADHTPIRFWQDKPGSVCFSPNPLPNTTSTLVYPYVTLAPLDLCAVPTWIWLEFSDVVVDGVLANLHEMPGVNKDKELAASKRRRYLQRRNAGRNRAQAGFVSLPGRMPHPYFARGSQR